MTDETGYCPIDATSMRSAVDENIFVIGDASIAGAMPKSAFGANSQAKVAVMNIRGDLFLMEPSSGHLEGIPYRRERL